MCAICGFFSLKDEIHSEARLQLANDAGRHRGPDGAGLLLVGAAGSVAERHGETAGTGGGALENQAWRVGLAHRRLAILDLSAAGHQPMSWADGRYWIVFNGEIYNYIELREELIALGMSFRSHSDTEVILAAYAKWGPECLRRFNGMWAFALYDRQRRLLFCARDRFGVKPFHYWIEPGQFAFASELKQLRVLCEGAWRANRAVLGDFFLWKLQTHTAETPVEGVLNLPPSHYVELTETDVRAGRAQPQRYWEPRPATPLDDREATGRFRELLADAVRLRLRSDVPVGVTLSGGLDSSAVTYLAAEARGREVAEPLLAFTAAYSDRGYSEESFARLVAERTGARHILIRPNSGELAADWLGFAQAMEEPFGSLSFFSNWKVYEQIRAHGVKVVLSGQGGDELLLGYQRYRVPLISLYARRGKLGQVCRELWNTPGQAGFSVASLLMYLVYFSFPLVRSWRRCGLVGRFLQPEFLDAAAGHREHLIGSMRIRDRQDLQRKEFFQYQLQQLLRHEDRVSMSHGVETRLPFLDYRLFEFMLGQADTLLIRDGWSKWVLRECLKDLLPDPIRLRKDKMGFETPTGRLIQDNHAFFSDLMRRQHDDSLLNIPKLLEEYERGGIEEGFLCSACSYLSWKEQFNIQN